MSGCQLVEAHAAGLEHHSTPASDHASLTAENFSQVQRGQRNQTSSPIRQRLKQWSKENGMPIINPETSIPPIPLDVASTQVQISLSDSIGLEHNADGFAGEEMADQGLDSIDGFTYDWSASATPLNPGDMAELAVPGASGPSESLCILVRNLAGYNQFLTSKGYWYISNRYLLTSGKIENFASPDELATIIPHIPQSALLSPETGGLPVFVSQIGDIPIEITAPIVNRLAQVDRDTNSFLRKHALAFDRLYETLADDNDLTEWKLEDLVPKAFGFPYGVLSTAGLLAISRFTISRKRGMIPWYLNAQIQGLWVRSRRDVQMKGQVTRWARMYQESAAKSALGKGFKEDLRTNPLSDFINKAHRLILKSRKIRSPTTIGLLGPSADSGNGGVVQAVDTGETLTENDKLIIDFIFATSHVSPPMVPREAQSICALIYRAIGAYTNLNLGNKVAHLLLQELGVLSPWSERATRSYALRLPGRGVWPYLDRLVAKAEATCKDLASFRDSVVHNRKDWGQMPVYCIDSRGTVEIDDGVSIERDTGMPDCAWIHVHIANPTAYLSRNHPISIAASDIVSSTYTGSNKFRMMPLRFAEGISSVGTNRPVMTVSTLIQANGSVVDVKLSLGTVHNVIRLTPDAVDGALEGKGPEMATMVIGGQRPIYESSEEEKEALEQALPELRLMRQYLHRRFRRRMDDWPKEEQIIRIPALVRSDAWSTQTEEPNPLSLARLSHWKGDPIITVEANRFTREQNLSEFAPIVEQAMLLAGESAAKWCKDRDIPILFHVATPQPLYPVSKLNQLQESDYRFEPAARLSTIAEPHWGLMMFQYTKITSPIRRYPDLVNQWQIQAYLEAVSCPDPKVAQVTDPLSRIPFTRQEIADMTKPLGERLRRLKQAGYQASDQLVAQALFRAFHFKEAQLPEVWDFRVSGPCYRPLPEVADCSKIMGNLLPFNAVALLLFSKENWEKDIKRCQFLPVKIEQVDAEQEMVLVRAVGPASDRPLTTHPVHVRSSPESRRH